MSACERKLYFMQVLFPFGRTVFVFSVFFVPCIFDPQPWAFSRSLTSVWRIHPLIPPLRLDRGRRSRWKEIIYNLNRIRAHASRALRARHLYVPPRPAPAVQFAHHDPRARLSPTRDARLTTPGAKLLRTPP